MGQRLTPIRVNDRVISANGISLENVDYNQAIHVLRECGNSVNLLIKRRALITSTANVNLTNANHHANADSMNNLLKITLTRNSKKEGKVEESFFFSKEKRLDLLFFFLINFQSFLI